MSDLSALCRRAVLQQRKVLAIYLTTGFPQRNWTVPLARAIFDAGADLIELGIPFSDPLADGPTIQHASTVALKRGFKRDDVPEAAREMSGLGSVLVMGYLNSLFGTDDRNYVHDLAESGVRALIIPDLPIDEEPELWNGMGANDPPLIPFVSPTTPLTRIRQIDTLDAPFVYAVSLAGVTGARKSLSQDVMDYIRRVKAQMTSPVLVGFGVSTAESAAKLAAIADGVIVGSAIIERIEQAASLDEAVQSVREFVAGLRQALDHVTKEKVLSC